jgi:hypothetical protein
MINGQTRLMSTKHLLCDIIRRQTYTCSQRGPFSMQISLLVPTGTLLLVMATVGFRFSPTKPLASTLYLDLLPHTYTDIAKLASTCGIGIPFLLTVERSAVT